MIRAATADDMSLLLRLAEAFHAESPYRESIPFDEETMRQSFENLISAGWLLTDGEHGMIGFIVFPCFFNISFMQAQEAFWFVDKSARKSGLGIKLLSEAEKVAKAHGAKLMSMLCLESNRLDSLYSELGYNKGETTFMKVL